VVRQLEDLGAEIVATDPVAIDRGRPLLPRTSLVADPYEALTGADAVGIVTDWPEYRDLDWGRALGLMKGRLVVDGRNCLDGEVIAGHGGIYLSMGRRPRGPGAPLPGAAAEAGSRAVPSVPLG
jgi:UDPglucose 6-dehydrogenase